MSNDPFDDDDDLIGTPIDAHFEPAPADPEPAPRPRPGWIALGAASLAAALIGAAAGVYGASLTGPKGDLAALETRLNQVAAVQAAIDEKLAEPAAASAELGGLIRQLDTVSRRLDQAIATGGDPEALAELNDRLDALERRAPATPSADVALLTARLASLEASMQAAAAESTAAVKSSGSRANAALALSAIESATRRGNGFEADYRALRSAAPGNDQIKRLAPYVSGVTSLSTLQAEFPKLRAAILAATTPETSGKLSWIDRTFGDAVSVRPANSKHSAVAKALDAASAALDAGDLPRAVKSLAGLNVAAAAVAEDWTRRANRRITLEEALEDVRLSLIEGGN